MHIFVTYYDFSDDAVIISLGIASCNVVIRE